MSHICFLILIKCDSGRANEECNLDPTVHLLKKEDLTPTQVRKLRYQGFCRKTCDLCDDIIFEKEAKKEEIKLGKFWVRIIVSKLFFCRGRELYRGVMPGVQPLTIARKSRG